MRVSYVAGQLRMEENDVLVDQRYDPNPPPSRSPYRYPYPYPYPSPAPYA